MSNSENKGKKNSLTTNVIIVEDDVSVHTKKTLGSGKSSNKEIVNNKLDTKENKKDTKNNDKISEISKKSAINDCVGCEGGGLMKLLSILKFWDFGKTKEDKEDKEEVKESPQKDEDIKSPERFREDNTLDNSNEPATADRLNASSKNQLNSPFKSRLYDSSNVIGEIEDEENYNEEDVEVEEDKNKKSTTNIYMRSPRKTKKSFLNKRSINDRTEDKKENETNAQDEMYRVISVVTNESDKKTKFSISTYAKSIKSKKKKGPNGQVKEEDIENLIEKNSFPCQYNDFTNLTFELDEMDLFYQTFSISEATEYHIEKDEEICCLMEGLYYKEKDKGDRIFLIITTLKLMILKLITETTVSVGLTIALKDIESAFFCGDKFYLIVESGNDKIKLLYEMGYKGYHPEKDKNFYKTPEKNEENTFLFIVTLWRMKFINDQSFLRVMKIPNLIYTEVKLKNNNYLFDILRKIQENSILKELKSILSHEKDNKGTNNKSKKLKKSEDQMCFANMLIPHKNKGIAFSHDKYGYCQVIVKIMFGHLIIYDYMNDHLCYIELSTIVKIAINESRLLVIIFFHDGKDFEKIALFSNKLDDEEFELFKPIYVFLIEANRRKTLNFEFWTGNLEIVYNNNIVNDDWDFYDLVKNSHRLKHQESENELKRKAKKLKHGVLVEKQDLEAKITPVKVVEYDCCCRKVKKQENKSKEAPNNNIKKDENDIVPEKSSCFIF